MIVKRAVLFLVMLIFVGGAFGCHRHVPPARDAKVISEQEMDMDDSSSKKSKPAAGGGVQLDESQW